jgi:hypothetical protein
MRPARRSPNTTDSAEMFAGWPGGWIYTGGLDQGGAQMKRAVAIGILGASPLAGCKSAQQDGS